MKYLQAQNAMNTFSRLVLTPTDLVELFKKSGYPTVTYKDFQRPKLDLENATIYEIGDAVKLQVPVKVRCWGENDDVSEVTVFVSVFAGSDGSVLVEGSF